MENIQNPAWRSLPRVIPPPLLQRSSAGLLAADRFASSAEVCRFVPLSAVSNCSYLARSPKSDVCATGAPLPASATYGASIAICVARLGTHRSAMEADLREASRRRKTLIGRGAADKAENLAGCESPYRQLPVFRRLAYPVRAAATKHDRPGCKSPSCPAVVLAAVGTIPGGRANLEAGTLRNTCSLESMTCEKSFRGIDAGSRPTSFRGEGR
jgi:hypothetical protein